jgi:hypothetical protein
VKDMWMLGQESPSMTGHVVIQPRANPHRTLRLVTDLDLLLAHTIASVRLTQRTIVFEPPPSLAACERGVTEYGRLILRQCSITPPLRRRGPAHHPQHARGRARWT